MTDLHANRGQTGLALGQVFADIRGTLASLMSSKGTPEGLQRIILSWDFWEIEDQCLKRWWGHSPIWRALPKSFDSAEVLRLSQKIFSGHIVSINCR